MSQLEIENIVKKYDDGENTIIAVNDVSISVDDGDFLVLVGPSGCGKTTTLHSVAGLVNPESGDIRLGGRSIIDDPPQERDVAMVFQDYALYPHMTVKQNMRFGLKMSTDLSKDQQEKRVESAAEMLGIGDLMSKKPEELSGGQQQRVALGRAIVRDPEVFLMDEPLSNLDAKLRREMRTELQDLQQELDTTTVYVTHDQTEAMTMGDKIAVLDAGELQQVGEPMELFNEPENQFVAGFIGDPAMNFFEGQIDNKTITAGQFTLPISDQLAETAEGHPEIIVGIRPDDLEIVDSNTEQNIETEVHVIEPLGEQTYVYTEINENEIVVSVDDPSGIIEGEMISLSLDEEDIYLFDTETGETIHMAESRVGKRGSLNETQL